eukprot:gene4961-6936_t
MIVTLCLSIFNYFIPYLLNLFLKWVPNYRYCDTIELENQLLSLIVVPICTIDLPGSLETFLYNSAADIDYKNSSFFNLLSTTDTIIHVSDFLNSFEILDSESFIKCIGTVSSEIYPDESKVIYKNCHINGVSWSIHFFKLKSKRILLQFESTGDFVTEPLKTSKYGNTFLDDHDALVDFLENAPRSFHVVDQDYNIIWGNKFELEVLGYTKEEFIGHHFSEFMVEGHDEILRSLASWNDGVPYIDNFIKYQGKSIVHIMRLETNRRLLPNGKWTSRSLLNDDTENQILEAAKEDQRQTTENMLELKRTFVRYVSHEIRSPLNVLYGGLQMLVHEPNTLSNPILTEQVTDLFTSCGQAIEILNDMLHYEKIEAGKFHMEKTNISLKNWDLITQCRPFIKMAESRDINFKIDWPPTKSLEYFDRLFMVADNIRINQVIRNLVTNAIKFSRSGDEVNVVCEINPYSGSESAVIATLNFIVSDIGPGIALDKQEFLFKQFSQFDRNVLQGGGGSGLGLWISNAIIDAHGGEMKCISCGCGLGSSFSFVLPLYLLPMSSTLIDRENCINLLEQKNLLDNFNDAKEIIDDGLNCIKPMKSFLIVDDSPLNRKVLRRMLLSIESNCRIEEADDGTTCIQMFINNQPLGCEFDCIFLDFVMTTYHGPKTAEILRKDYGFKGPIIGVTGNALADDILIFEAAGANLVLTKPVRIEKLGEVISMIH